MAKRALEWLQRLQIYPHSANILSVPRCRKRAWGRPCKVPARETEGWCRGSWWSQRGSLQAEKTPWSQTSHTASAVLHLASLHPHTGRCPPRSDISLMASEETERGKEWIYRLNIYNSTLNPSVSHLTPLEIHTYLYDHIIGGTMWHFSCSSIVLCCSTFLLDSRQRYIDL